MSSFSHFREQIKRVPVIGSFLYRIYLLLFFREGEVVTIKDGYLKGMTVRRFHRTVFPRFIAGDYELELQNAIIHELKEGHVFYDVGANGGFFCLVAAKRMGPSGKIVAIEPHPKSTDEIRKQLAHCGYLNHSVVTAAVSDREGRDELADDTVSHMASLTSLEPDARPKFTIEVPTVTLDQMVKEHGAPDVLKLDMEGAEIMALRGADLLLRQHAPVLLVELHNEDLCRQYYDLMDDLDYRTYQLSGEPILNREFCRHVLSRKN